VKYLAILFSVVLIAYYGYFTFWAVSPQRALPSELKDTYKDFYEVTGIFNSDFTYCMKVESNKEQFLTFSENLRLRQGTSLAVIPSCIDQRHPHVRWNKKRKEDVEYIYENKDTTSKRGEISFYKDGMLYFKAWDY